MALSLLIPLAVLAAAVPQGVGERLEPAIFSAAPTHERWPAQVAKLCSQSDSDGTAAAWNLVHDDQGELCTCSCNAADCMVAECPAGYELEELGSEEAELSDGSDFECARYETIEGITVPAEEKPVVCPEGALQVKADHAACVVERDCPPPPSSVDGAMSLRPAESCGPCEYEVKCTEPAHLKIQGGTAVCVTPAKRDLPTTRRKTAPHKQGCPAGSKLVDGACRKALEVCPVLLPLDPTAIACGPHSDKYIKRMLKSMRDQVQLFKKEGVSDSNHLSCATSCHSIFTKFSECVYQNDGPTCVGRAARSGKAIQAIGGHGSADKSKGAPKWLKKLNKAQSNLPCKDMYGSEHNFKSGWLSAVERIEHMAAADYILLLGEYATEPIGNLDCRRSFCRKSSQYASRASGHASGLSLNLCLAGCAAQYK
eukprot:gb/GFBE01042685.1/.p1 GENE.gb/GFBE01042685.1/~~gb/GFBE01042685.1/.p1  ORF type:complete len:426 (+),score=74.71 gb/GFBE01042685.1/:1-1278(+)